MQDKYVPVENVLVLCYSILVNDTAITDEQEDSKMSLPIAVYERGRFRLEEWMFSDKTTGHYVFKKKGKPISNPSEEEALALIVKYNMKEV